MEDKLSLWDRLFNALLMHPLNKYSKQRGWQTVTFTCNLSMLGQKHMQLFIAVEWKRTHLYSLDIQNKLSDITGLFNVT